MALLLRFYVPEAGVILLDGVDIAAVPVSWLRSQIGRAHAIFCMLMLRVVTAMRAVCARARESGSTGDLPTNTCARVILV